MGATHRATRTAAVVIPDWPLLCAGERLGIEGPVILMHRHRVHIASSEATAAGVTPGMRRRTAQALAPNAHLADVDEAADAALFDTAAAAVDTVAAGVDILRPGVLLVSAKGPARHHGSEEAFAIEVTDALAERAGWECTVGIADGPFAALLAARSGRIIHPGRSAEYLSPHPIQALSDAPVGPGWGHREHLAPEIQQGRSTSAKGSSLDIQDVIGVLTRLGIKTLGDFAALPPSAVADRFGPDVALLHLLALGGEAYPPTVSHPRQPIDVLRVLDPPVVRLDQAAFLARPLAEELQRALRREGCVCTRLRISLLTEDGQEIERMWRHDGALDVPDIVDRIRWQCDGWITTMQRRGDTPSAIVRIGLHPLQISPSGASSLGLWGRAGQAGEQAARAFARIQATVGEAGVVVPYRRGSRFLAEEMAAVPWRVEPPAPKPGPWPGSLPAPTPSIVFRDPPAIEVTDEKGQPVLLTSRGLLSSPPVWVSIPPQAPAPLTAVFRSARPRIQTSPPAPSPSCESSSSRIWIPVREYGIPQVLDERWWDKDGQSTARWQICVDDACGLLLLGHNEQWRVEGIYD
ncbi:DNA polymerase Y family protein [Devriesea agamarum]|uniref:DNA polymerase Y family protein n=1 Tax=Devriesea agamarum TaxID=472569 RepID=UPI00071E25D7|nr:DNA repair nucleotidyltransferase [Devriesea agamarum]